MEMNDRRNVGPQLVGAEVDRRLHRRTAGPVTVDQLTPLVDTEHVDRLKLAERRTGTSNQRLIRAWHSYADISPSSGHEPALEDPPGHVNHLVPKSRKYGFITGR